MSKAEAIAWNEASCMAVDKELEVRAVVSFIREEVAVSRGILRRRGGGGKEKTKEEEEEEEEEYDLLLLTTSFLPTYYVCVDGRFGSKSQSQWQMSMRKREIPMTWTASNPSFARAPPALGEREGPKLYNQRPPFQSTRFSLVVVEQSRLIFQDTYIGMLPVTNSSRQARRSLAEGKKTNKGREGKKTQLEIHGLGNFTKPNAVQQTTKTAVMTPGPSPNPAQAHAHGPLRFPGQSGARRHPFRQIQAHQDSITDNTSLPCLPHSRPPLSQSTSPSPPSPQAGPPVLLIPMGKLDWHATTPEKLLIRQAAAHTKPARRAGVFTLSMVFFHSFPCQKFGSRKRNMNKKKACIIRETWLPTPLHASRCHPGVPAAVPCRLKPEK
ncbi:hypothetical protein L249_0120 [Ophiocordyceps polyrhachis-furcata BCC 54312]|uniref:Uncharacterized protein n=1 Tax=Ophiocordyceps polyrhachis-furcata BCC 54312 TaxID=1330021 RepID=A0A367LFN8_9HYPO|nr:hypothetical protein L249_0120 [Ophiocordyceps polyrhachis-furcata BCC 54312]